MIQIMKIPADELGDLVCKIMNEELNETLYFDYIQLTEEEYLFRWMFEDDSFMDLGYLEMAKEFKTLDNLVVHLIRNIRFQQYKKEA